ncbi:hypothetical protein GmHk_U059917 [Glycine max]|nr:hypothetical protein GmHk_U059917 [Glycine max]
MLADVCPESLPIEDMIKSKGKDPLEGLGGPMTRARARKAKEALQQVLSILFEYKPKFQGEKSKVASAFWETKWWLTCWLLGVTGPFQVLERINDNVYKVELPGEYNVSSTFNYSDLSLFDADGESDLRTNPSQEGENDEDMTKSKGKDPLEGLGGPMTMI